MITENPSLNSTRADGTFSHGRPMFSTGLPMSSEAIAPGIVVK